MTEPTALSKIIPVNLDFNSSSSLNWKPFNTGRAFWTKDIGTAFLEFSTELDLTGTVASIVLENQYDKSLVQKTISGITASPFYYQLGDEIQHDGRWFVQISVTKGEETIVSNSFAFMVNASIGHGKVARLISIETFETLATQLTLLQTSINDYLTTAQESESIRVSTYEEVVLAEQERKDAEDTRKAISMADHSTAQSDHSTAQSDHTTATADHGIAVTDHTTAVSDHSISQSDHSISLTDHTTATADHGIAVTDHTTAVSDHASYEGLLTDGVLTTNIENTLQNLESTYAPDLLSVKQQLEQTLNKSAITLTHMFADNTARDAYFVANPSELIELQFIKVGTGYQQYLEGGWTDSVPIIAEQVSATNQPIVDTGGYFATDKTNDALQEIGDKIFVKAQNSITNGDFSRDTNADGIADNWTRINGPVCTLLNGEQTIENVDGFGNKRIEQSVSSVVGRKYYFRAQAKMVSGSGGVLKLYVGGTDAITVSATSYTNYSQILTSTISTGTVIQLSIITAIGKMAVKNALIIDLTATFGAGNEPTVAQMDRLLTQFPNSWFDGTENLFFAKWALNELRRLDSEKANKVQEAWITPTLLNGWTGVMKYAKSDNGFVTVLFDLIAGTSSYFTNLAQLPTGYFPQFVEIGVLLRDSGGTGTLSCHLQITTGGYVKVLSGITSGKILKGSVTYYGG